MARRGASITASTLIHASDIIYAHAGLKPPQEAPGTRPLVPEHGDISRKTHPLKHNCSFDLNHVTRPFIPQMKAVKSPSCVRTSQTY